jgi:hypothetical protein
MTKTTFYDLQENFVCSCAIRISRDLFTFLPLHTVIVHAADNQLAQQPVIKELRGVNYNKTLRHGGGSCISLKKRDALKSTPP